ncbi:MULTISPECIES: hypothetical protein [Streptomyces]|uniref:Uncharacterized protein n=1 Tax=Streptomyces chilikensis TaxID=1194079 RepID=A0ABV3EK04_9ACTN|nr:MULTISPECIES: hypothetical protein [Streptomyces]MDH6223150.1 hypothetical protein [Streptomyces sp. MJP52]
MAMTTMLRRIKAWSATPQGRRTIEQARRAAADPRNRAHARRLLTRLRAPRR